MPAGAESTEFLAAGPQSPARTWSPPAPSTGLGIEGVLLDVDGTLIDTNAAHAHAWVDALEEAKVQVSVERLRWLIGKGADKILPEVAGIDAASKRGRAISSNRQDIFLRRYLPFCDPLPGARALIERLQADGVRCVVASSAQQRELRALLERARLDDLIAPVSDDGQESKPDPDIVQTALTAGGLFAARAVMVGDTPYDVEAALRANVRVIGVRCGGWDDAGLAGAAAIYDNPADLLAHYDDSPLRNAHIRQW